MTVRIIVFFFAAALALQLAFSGNLGSRGVTDRIGIQAIRDVFDAMR
jgi:hypothetical protein